YVRRLIEDAELRDNIRSAYQSARSAYGRVSNGKGPAKALLDDKKVHKDLRNAADALRDASDALRAKQRSRTWPKLLLIGLVGAGVALAFSEDALEAGRSVDEPMAAFFALVSRTAQQDQGQGYACVVSEIFVASRSNPEIKAALAALYAEARSVFAGILRAKEREGVLRLRFDA